MELTKKEKKWVDWILYGLFLIVICEITLRVYVVYLANPNQFEILASRNMLENRFGAVSLIKHRYLGHVNNPAYQYKNNRHNSHGFRGEELLDPKPEGTIRIVCVGGSTTYSQGVKDYQQSYPFLLNESLKEKGIEAEVINAGVLNYNSLQTYINYHLRVKELQPDILIVYHGVNDMWPRMVWPHEAYLADQSGAYEPSRFHNYAFLRRISLIRIPLVLAGVITPDGVLEDILEVSRTNRFHELRTQLFNKTYPKGIFKSVSLDSIIQTNSPVFYEKNLDRLIRHANSNGTQVVLSTFVYSDQFQGYFPEFNQVGFQRGIEDHNAVMRMLSVKHDIPLIDLAAELSVDKELFTDGMHFTHLGNQKRVEIMANQLAPIIYEIYGE